MRPVIAFLLLLSSLVVKAQEGPVNFVEGDWAQTLAAAKKANKPVFLYAWSLSCGPCREMARDVFPDPAVGRYYNATFVNYKVNVDKGAGEDVAKQYGIRVLPAYLYFDAQGNLLHRSGSGKAAAAFIQDGKDAFDPNKAYFKLKARYEAGERGADLLYTLSTADGMHQETTLYDQVAADYFKSQSAAELASPKNLAYIFEARTAFNSPVTQYFLSHKAAFNTRFGADEVSRKTRNIINREVGPLATKNDLGAFNALQAAIGRVMPNEAAQWKAMANLSYLLGQHERNWPKFADAALAYGHQYAAQDSRSLADAAAYIKFFVEDKALLRKADQIIQQAIAVNASYDNLLTQAELLHKLGDNVQAATVAKQAIAAASKTSEHTEGATELLASLVPQASKAK
jgi:thiol-disulfide isomerase/thioredoxin